MRLDGTVAADRTAPATLNRRPLPAYPPLVQARRQSEHNERISLGSGPQVSHDIRSGAAHCVGDRGRDENRVVDLANDREEIGHEVERHGQVRQDETEGDLRPPRNAGVPQQAFDQDDAIRHESGEVACALPAADRQQYRDQQHPERDRRSKDDREREPAIQAATARRSSSNSAIWMALSAAPLRRLSLTTKRTRPFATVGSRRMRPTRTSSIPTDWRGVGKSSTRTPGAWSSRACASRGESCSRVSIQTASAWPTRTGTRTHVALIGRSDSSRIFRASALSFVSSSNSSPSQSQSIPN